MANKVYVNRETAVTFCDSGGTVVLTLQNLAYGAGRISAQWDRGDGAKPAKYFVRGVFQFETAPVVGEIVEVVIAESDGTYADGGVGTSDAALTAGQKLNLGFACAVKAQTTDTATSFIGHGIVEIHERYVQVGVWNHSAGDNLENTANASRVILTPLPDEIQ
jgi:hypothetical protein